MKDLKINHNEENLFEAFGISEEREKELNDLEYEFVEQYLMGSVPRSKLIENLYNLGENEEEKIYIVATVMGTVSRMEHKMSGQGVFSFNPN